MEHLCSRARALGLKASLGQFLCALTLFAFIPGCAPTFKPIPTFKHVSEQMAYSAAIAEAALSGGYVSRISGTSMEPTIVNPSFGVFVFVDYDELKKDDIVRYKPTWTDNFVAHRCVLKDSDGWIMSGDNNAHSENKERMTRENYLGKLQSVHKW